MRHLGDGRENNLGLVVAIRACALLALAAPTLWSRELPMVVSLGALCVVWSIATALLATQVPAGVTTLLEAAAVAVICGASLSYGTHLLSALAIAPFVAGLWRGSRGVLEALAVESACIALVDGVGGAELSAEQVAAAFSWLVTGMGFGLVASFFRHRADTGDSSQPYREARMLLRDLLDLSGRLSSGLDATSLGGEILDEFAAEVPTSTSTLHVRRSGDIIPLVVHTSTDHAESAASDALAHAAWDQRALHLDGHDFALPLTVSGTTVAVISGHLSPGIDTAHVNLPAALTTMARRLEPVAVRLDTAQLFAEFRDTATSDERRRFAREIHDGVAQDIASMGYLVDAMSSTAPAPLIEPLAQLRAMITQVVGEVRRSVMTLRTQAGESESLGAAIATLARHLGDVSGIPIQVTVDERTSRLRHEVEAELLRIAQEAMTNAVKHSGASVINVHCRVAAPTAEITVRDDGHGIQEGRVDSHGLSIMRERAELVGAELSFHDDGQGTTVRVRIGGRPPAEAGHPFRADKVSS